MKKVIATILVFITIIVNNILTTCIYPESFKCGLISPVPMPGDPQETKIWCPVTILNALLKVVERVINLQLKTHIHYISDPVDWSWRRFCLWTISISGKDHLIIELVHEKLQ